MEILRKGMGSVFVVRGDFLHQLDDRQMLWTDAFALTAGDAVGSLAVSLDDYVLLSGLSAGLISLCTHIDVPSIRTAPLPYPLFLWEHRL